MAVISLMGRCSIFPEECFIRFLQMEKNVFGFLVSSTDFMEWSELWNGAHGLSWQVCLLSWLAFCFIKILEFQGPFYLLCNFVSPSEETPMLTCPIEKQLFSLGQRPSVAKDYNKNCLHIVLPLIIHREFSRLFSFCGMLHLPFFTQLFLVHQLSGQALLLSQGFPCSRTSLHSKNIWLHVCLFRSSLHRCHFTFIGWTHWLWYIFQLNCEMSSSWRSGYLTAWNSAWDTVKTVY